MCESFIQRIVRYWCYDRLYVLFIDPHWKIYTFLFKKKSLITGSFDTVNKAFLSAIFAPIYHSFDFANEELYSVLSAENLSNICVFFVKIKIQLRERAAVALRPSTVDTFIKAKIRILHSHTSWTGIIIFSFFFYSRLKASGNGARGS